jgi:hypothetical protein
MRHLVLAGIVMALGASVQAIPVAGTITCGGTAPNETCGVTVTCSDSCSVTSSSFVNADCTAMASGSPIVMTAIHNNMGANPSCTWGIEDSADGRGISVTINGSDGLPVKLLSFSIE